MRTLLSIASGNPGTQVKDESRTFDKELSQSIRQNMSPSNMAWKGGLVRSKGKSKDVGVWHLKEKVDKL